MLEQHLAEGSYLRSYSLSFVAVYRLLRFNEDDPSVRNLNSSYPCRIHKQPHQTMLVELAGIEPASKDNVI